MIEQVYFSNFKALRDVVVPLAPITLVVGPNASGKTTILEGLHYLTQLGSKPPAGLFQGRIRPDRIRTIGVPEAVQLGATGRWRGVAGTLTVTCEPRDASGNAWSLGISGRWNNRDIDFRIRGSAATSQYEPPTTDEPLLTNIRSAVFLHLDPDRLAAPAFSDEGTRIEFDGSNLAAVLADLATEDPNRYRELIQRIGGVVPSVRMLSLRKARIDKHQYEQTLNYDEHGAKLYRRAEIRYMGHQILLDFQGAEGVWATHASEGTLLTIGLLTILCAPSRPRLVLIDELERGLHPRALGELVRQLREIQKELPDLQIVGTTHSPYLVDHFAAEEIVLTALRDDASVAVGRLNDHPEFDRWKDEMKPGEFWSTVGEEWVVESKRAESSAT